MSSSISSSEPAPEWGRWLDAFLGALALGAALVVAFVIAVDPYDSGRFGFLGIEGVSDLNPRTANASRARDPQFDSAIIGDSTAQLLKPSELSALTGLRFVQLTMPGSGPREQLAVLDFFMRHHARIGAVIIAVDGAWCTRDAALPLRHPFPFWLYGESKLGYAAGLFSSRSLGRAWRRALIGLGLRERTRADGYWDYEATRPHDFRPAIAPYLEPVPPFTGVASDVFPAIPRLKEAIDKLPADVPVVLLAPPLFYTHIARAGGAAAADDDACKRALKGAVEGRARGAFIDYRVDNALTRDPANFMDYVHTSAAAARQMEREIAMRIRFADKASNKF
jgi:hypothetical protein